MAKHIDADCLKWEIERLKETHERNLKKPMERGRIGYAHGCIDCCDRILSFIDSLQQEQSFEDLEVRKQIEELANNWHHKGFASDEDCPLCMQDLIDILWHFYELGQRKAKEEGK